MNLDFTVDVLTHSVVLVKTAESFKTEVLLLESQDLKQSGKEKWLEV